MGFPAGAEGFDQVNGIMESTVFLETMTPSIQGLPRVSFNFITCRGGGPGGNQMPMGGVGGPLGGVGGPMGPVGGVGMRDFFQPRAASGKRVDHCAAFNPNMPGFKGNQMAYQGCGQPAADIFCRNNGFQRAIHFETGACVRAYLLVEQHRAPANLFCRHSLT